MEIYNAIDSVENNMMLSQNIKNEITIWLGNSIFEYIPKRTENSVSRHIYTPIFTVVQVWEQPTCPSKDE